jgi:hypothetical protein
VNEGVRILADWFNDVTAGATSIADVIALADFAKDAADSLPTAPTIYDGTRNAWAARGLIPRASQGVTFPLVAVRFVDAAYDLNPRQDSTGFNYLFGQATFAIMTAQRLTDPDENKEDVGYLERATLGSLYALHSPTALSKRRRNAYELTLPLSIRVQPFQPQNEDNIGGADILVTYKTR